MAKKTGILIAFLLLVVALLSTVPGLASAQDRIEITVSDSSAQTDFPLALNFSALISSNVDIIDIRLRYRVEQLSFAEVYSEAYVNFTKAKSVDARHTLDLRRIGGLPPGVNLSYWWVVRNAGGAVLESDPAEYQIYDSRYRWQNITLDKINLFWYQGNESFAQSLMEAAQQSLVKLAEDTGATPDNMINIYIYASPQDLQGSMIYPQEWTGGVAFTQYSIISIGISPDNLDWGRRAMVHELTHNVINQETYNPYGGIPVWLNEGLAMYSEGELTPQFLVPLINAFNSDTLFSVRSISSPFSAYPDKANLAYAQSHSLVDYLIRHYGSGKMLDLLGAFRQGSTYDAALQNTYGFNMDGLDDQWRSWINSQYGN